MSDKKISELTQTTTINQADVSVLVSGGTDYKFAFSTLLQFLSSNLAVGANISFGTTLPQNTSGKDRDVFINTNTGSFAQKLSGIWSVVYTLPSSDTQTDGTVLYGLGAPGSTTGNNNDTYINTGTGIFYKKTAGAWSQVFSMQSGPQGPQGVAGANGTNGTNGFSILNGNGNPSNSATGVDGDFYINTSTYVLFGPKTGGIWPEGVSLIPPGLKPGGTSGQVLTKASNDDYDSQWSTLDVSFGGLSGEPGDNAALGTALDGKVDKVAGYGLSQNDFTDEDKILTESISGKQNTLIFDEQPLSGSNNPVKSGGIWAFVNNSLDSFQSLPGGGTAGQILAKIDDTDGNVDWIDAPTGGDPDGLISGGAATVSGQTVTIQPVTWRISGVDLSTVSATDFLLADADPVNGRYDVIYGDNSGDLNIIEGYTSANPVKPTIPNDTIEIAVAYVEPGTISTIGVELANYATKQDVLNVTGDKASLQTDGKDNLVEAINEVRRKIFEINQDNLMIKAFKYSNYK